MHSTLPAAKAVLLAALIAIVPAVRAQAPDSARAPSPDPLFTSRDALYAGAVGLATLAVAPLDKKFADFLQGTPQANRWLRRLSRGVETITLPGAWIIGGGLYGIGRIAGNDRMADLGLHGTEAIVVGLGVTSVIKFTAGRARPYVGRDHPHDFAFGRGFKHEEYRSFPSGHTLIAFAAATAVTDEARRWEPSSLWYVAPAMYGGAALVGLSRMYDNKHWASDVVMGAAMGAFSGRKVVRYHHEHPRNNLDRWLLNASITPAAGGGRTVRLFLIPQR
ncbi:MAG: phosphatase PAP2 family protein [Gemmatimonadaceae bacterium]